MILGCADRTAITSGACVHIAGTGNISNCNFIQLDHATDVQRGVWIAEKGSASPGDDGGKYVTITGIRVGGTGVNAVGIDVEGRNSSIGTCAISLSGANSTGIFVRQGIGGLSSEQNTISACTIEAEATGISLTDEADDCIVNSCVVDGASTGIKVDGLRCQVNNNIIINGTTGIDVLSNARDVAAQGNTISNMTGDGINLTAGGEDAFIVHNKYVTVVGLDVDDNATNTRTVDETYIFLRQTKPADSVGIGVDEDIEYFVPGTELVMPTQADGARVWNLVSRIWYGETGAGGDVFVRLRQGTNTGSPGSDVLLWTGESTTDSERDDTLNLDITPADGDSVYWTIERTSEFGSADVFSDEDWRTTYLRVFLMRS